MPQRNAERIMIAGGTPETETWLGLLLRRQAYHVQAARDGGQLLALLRTAVPTAAVLLDVELARMDGMKLLRAIRAAHPEMPVVVVGGALPAAAVAEMRENGAADFLNRTAAGYELAEVVRRVVERASRQRTPGHPGAPAAEFFLGPSARMKQLAALARQVASSDAPILIQGETGCGKEVLARYIHDLSRHARLPLLRLNCAALGTEELERVLFGGELPGGDGETQGGILGRAAGTAVLLDDVEHLDLKVQARLLTALQEREAADALQAPAALRIIAVTRADLRAAVAAGGFREDLYYYLNVIRLRVPPLRERHEDILPMAEMLIRKHCSQGSTVPEFTEALKRELLRYGWPGNVRELETIMRRLCILRDGDLIARELAEKLPAGLPPARPAETAPAASPAILPLRELLKAREQAEADAILAALNATWWNRKKAAGLLNIGYKALLYRMKRLGIEAVVPAPEPMRMIRTAAGR